MDDIRDQINGLLTDFIEEKERMKSFTPVKNKVQYAGPVYGADEIKAMVGSILDGWFGVGNQARKFEQEFASFLGTGNTLVTNSGSSANLIALSALKSNEFRRKIEPGDEIITQAVTFPTTFNPIVQNGFTPVLVDVDLGTYNPDIEQIERAISPKTKAIVILHQLGNPNPMSEIMALAKQHDLIVIEDTCDALGSKYDGKLVGTFGDMATFSFYVAHHMTMGEGGAIAVNDNGLNLICRSIRDWGRACACPICEVVKNPDKPCPFKTKSGILPEGYDIRYVYTNIGYNLKPMEFQAAMGRVQLKRVPEFIAKRNANFKQLYDTFKDYEEFFILPESLPKAEPAWFAFPLTIRNNAVFTRRDFLSFLEQRNIETRLFFAGNIIRHPAYLGLYFRTIGNLSNADKILRDSFFMGIYPGITSEKMNFVTASVREFMKKL
ncbi:lipopolysaccharide biosynthesis protein RfbH [bacterium]|nr:lipopolysaccharide biosynthesis protein RfbH [bacterium]